MARTFFLQERYSDASALCKSLIKDNPAQADLWMLQANAYLGLSEPMRAAENFEVVDHLGKSTVESLSILGDIYVNEELYDLASSAYMRAMEQDQDPTAKRTMRAAKVLAARSALDETRMLVEAIEAQKAQGFDDEQRKELLKLRAKLALATGSGDEEARILQEIVDIDVSVEIGIRSTGIFTATEVRHHRHGHEEGAVVVSFLIGADWMPGRNSTVIHIRIREVGNVVAAHGRSNLGSTIRDQSMSRRPCEVPVGVGRVVL